MGGKLPVADTASPLKDKDGNIIGVIVVFRDATEEQELQKMREQIINLTSHQLRSPTTIIKGYASLLADQKLPPETKDLVSKLRHATIEMETLINDLLDLSRLEQGKIDLEPEPVQFEEVVNTAMDEMEQLFKEKKIKPSYDGPKEPLPQINVSLRYITEAVQNIISNAIKFTNKKVKISIDQTDSIIQFSCADDGIGIPKKEQRKIFDKFFRASNTVKAQIRGTGLGLSIAKTVVEMSGGKIWFESEEGKGSTFYVSFPVTKK